MDLSVPDPGGDRALRVALAGFGLAGKVFHGPLIEHTDGLELSAIVTSDKERQAEARSRYPDTEVIAGLDDLWSSDPDLLVVAVPNRAHLPVATQAIERGVAVVVDKPIAVNAGDGRELAARARSAGVPLTVFQNRRWDGDFLTLQRLIDESSLGKVTRFESRFERFRLEIKQGWREHGDPAEGGGQLLDLGSHLVDQARVLFGHPVRVYAEIETRRTGAAVDDDVFIALEHQGGERSHLWMSSVAPLTGPRFRVSGLEAGFATDGLDPQEAQLTAGLAPDAAHFGQGPPGLLVDQRGSHQIQLEAGNYPGFYRAVVDWLRGDAPSPVEPDDAIAVLDLLEAARMSALQGVTIGLG